MMKFRQGLTSQGKKEGKEYDWGGVQRELQLHLNTVFLKLTALNLDFCSFVIWKHFIKSEILYIRGLLIQSLLYSQRTLTISQFLFP